MGRPGGGSSSWEPNIPEFNYADEGQGWFNRSLGKPKGVTDTGTVPPYEDFKNQYWKAAGAPEVLFMRPIDIPANQQQEFINASIEWEPKAKAAYDAQYGKGESGKAILRAAPGRAADLTIFGTGIGDIASKLMEPSQGAGAIAPADVLNVAGDVLDIAPVIKPVSKAIGQVVSKGAKAAATRQGFGSVGEMVGSETGLIKFGDNVDDNIAKIDKVLAKPGKLPKSVSDNLFTKADLENTRAKFIAEKYIKETIDDVKKANGSTDDILRYVDSEIAEAEKGMNLNSVPFGFTAGKYERRFGNMPKANVQFRKTSEISAYHERLMEFKNDLTAEIAKQAQQKNVPMAPGTSVQSGLTGFETKPQQVQMFGEAGGGGQKQTLVDVDKLKAAQANKPLEGQPAMPEPTVKENLTVQPIDRETNFGNKPTVEELPGNPNVTGQPGSMVEYMPGAEVPGKKGTMRTIKPESAGGNKPPELPPATTTKAEPPAPKEGFAGNIRLEKFPEAIRDDIKKTYEAIPQQAEAARRGTRTWQQTDNAAYDLVQLTGGDDAKLVKKVGQAYNAEESRALAGALINNIDEIHKMTEAINTPNGNSAANLLKLAELQRKNILLQLGRHGNAAEAGRALNIFRMINHAIKANTNPAMEAVIKQLGGRAKLEGLADIMAKIDWDNPAQVNAFIRSINKPRAMDYVYEYFINSILSGPKTHLRNFISNNIAAGLSVPEKFVAAGVERGLAKVSRRPVERFFSDAADSVVGAAAGIPDGLKSGLQTIRQGASEIKSSKYEYRPSAFGGKLGRVVNFPTNMMEASDALNYNIAFKSELYSLARRQAKIEGLTGQQLINRVMDLRQNPTTDMVTKAVNQAEYRLFRQPAGTFGQALLNFRESVDIKGFKPIKYVMPFINTPINLAKYGLERSPAGFLNPKLWSNLKKSNPEAADQIARALIGSTVAAGIAYYFGNGKITGAAPTSPGARDRFYREGKQPYSIKVGDTWFSYQQMEPFNQVFTLVSSVVNSVENKEQDVLEKATSAVNSIGKNFISQTYMSGLAELINAISEPEIYGKSWLENTVTGMLPFSGAVRTATQATDKTIRQPRNIQERLQSNIPGASQNVQPKLNVFSEPVQRQTPWYSPINLSRADESAINTELASLGVNTGFVGSSINGVKLTEEEQRAYQELAGPLEKQAIMTLIQNPAYRSLSIEDRQNAIQSATNQARAAARQTLNQQNNNKYGIQKSPTVKRRIVRRSTSRSYNAAKRRIIKSK
jgi:hypothetical protein